MASVSVDELHDQLASVNKSIGLGVPGLGVVQARLHDQIRGLVQQNVWGGCGNPGGDQGRGPTLPSPEITGTTDGPLFSTPSCKMIPGATFVAVRKLVPNCEDATSSKKQRQQHTLHAWAGKTTVTSFSGAKSSRVPIATFELNSPSTVDLTTVSSSCSSACSKGCGHSCVGSTSSSCCKAQSSTRVQQPS